MIQLSRLFSIRLKCKNLATQKITQKVFAKLFPMLLHFANQK